MAGFIYEASNSSSRNSLGSNSFTLTTTRANSVAIIACQDDANRTPSVNANGTVSGNQIFVGNFPASWKFFIIVGLGIGTHTINVSWGGGGAQSVACGAIWSGIKTTGTIPEVEGSYQGQNPGTSSTSSATVSTNGAWLFGISLSANTPSGGTGATMRATIAPSGGFYTVGFMDSNAGKTPGSQSIQVTQSSGELYYQSLVLVPNPDPVFTKNVFALGNVKRTNSY